MDRKCQLDCSGKKVEKQDAQRGCAERVRSEQMDEVGEGVRQVAIKEICFLDARHCVKGFIGMISFVLM